jgi:hypothetical protein
LFDGGAALLLDPLPPLVQDESKIVAPIITATATRLIVMFCLLVDFLPR